MRRIWSTAIVLTMAVAVPAGSAVPTGARPPAATPVAVAAVAAVAAALPAALPATVDTGGGALNVRAGPSVADRVVAELPDGAAVRVQCQEYGQSIPGPRRRSAYWVRLGPARYVADAYLRWRGTRPAVSWCGPRAPVSAVVASAGGRVNLRSGPGTRYRLAGRLPNGRVLVVRCQRLGERIVGPRGAARAWSLLADGRYVAGSLVAWRPTRPSALPWCGQAPPTVPAATRPAFIARVAPGARAGLRRYRVPASVTIAQAIHESGWGRSALARRDHNYFGIKCFGTPGPIAVGCRTYATTECGPAASAPGGSRCWRTRARFRAYRNPAGSMADHGRFLVVNPRYRPAFRFTGQPDRFARAIHRAGYATGPHYARNLIRIMRRYDLYRYDR
jgi:flagellar protein FlgJ